MRLQGWWLNCRAQQLQPTLSEWIDGATDKRIECNFIFYWVWLKCLIKCFHFFFYTSVVTQWMFCIVVFFFFNRVEVCFHLKLFSTDLELFQQPGSNVDYSIVWHVTGWMARLSSSKMFLRSVVSHHLETCTHRKVLGFFSKKDLNEWINKWITVLQGENSSPLWMWSCRLPLHSPWLPWLPCVTALAGQQPKRLRYNLKFPPRPVVLVAGNSFCPQAELRSGRQKRVSSLHPTSYPSTWVKRG